MRGDAFDFNRHRAREIAALVKYRHGTLPDTDDADIYICAAAPHLVVPKRGGGLGLAIEEWCIRVGRRPTGEELEAARHARRRRLSAEALGKRLRLWAAERSAIGITTIRAFDVDREESKRRRREKERERLRRLRALKGGTTRAEYLAASLTATRPWEAEGIARRTWERRRRRVASPYEAMNGRDSGMRTDLRQDQ